MVNTKLTDDEIFIVTGGVNECSCHQSSNAINIKLRDASDVYACMFLCCKIQVGNTHYQWLHNSLIPCPVSSVFREGHPKWFQLK